jgi:hypothetical protein
MKTRRIRKNTSQKHQKHQKHQLFNDAPEHRTPRTKGIGYGTAKKAKTSITLLKTKPKSYQRQVASTMFFRAKYHKYQTKNMHDAMKVWGSYIKQLDHTNKKRI